jgi:hypothetical protein
MRNIMGNYKRRDQQFEASEVRRVATKDLGCAPELLQ